MAQIIPKKHYPNSSTWNSSSWQAASILGPAAGGLLYGFYGITAAFSVILCFMFVALIFIYFFKPHPPAYILKESIMKSLSQGISFVLSQ